MKPEIERVVTEVAFGVRLWAERNAHRGRFKNNLAGMCAIASAKLFNELEARQVPEIRLAGNPGHCFVLVGDYVVDVTATQFGRKRVEIDHLRFYDDEPWRVEWSYGSARELQRHQETVRWVLNEIVWDELVTPT